MNFVDLRELSLGVIIVAIVIFIIIPLPTPLLDFLLMMNITLGILILLNSLYSSEPLEMSLFPTLLLVTTLYRLVLNVSTTRLILLNGYAGEVVNTFGGFVAGGNMIVGVIIFIIIVIVNFMVITKGSERVAEVTARFTLDAMPGKQMAIDADLNTGLIDEEEAKLRRKKIQDESNFYGAMDGASKFVKGDAIAGILITFVNIAAGLALGVTGLSTGEPLPLADAAAKYTVMTIGDGLASQIPALLISTATGIIVTKATNESGISREVSSQLFSKPLTLAITGGFLVFMGILTPLPWYIFVPFGGFLMYLSVIEGNKQKLAFVQSEISEDDIEAEAARKPENVVSLLNVDPILLLFGYGLIPLVDSSQGGDLLDRVVMIRRQIALELGAVVPVIHLRDDIKLSPNQYKIMIKGVEVASGELLFDHYMAMNPGNVEEEIDGIETVEPYMGLPALWILESQRERAEALGYTVVDPPAIIATHLTEVIRSHLFELLTRQGVQSLIDNVKQTNEVLVDELIPKLLTVGEVQKVLANLLREGISIRDLVTVLETLADSSHMTRDTDMLTEYARQALRRAISKKYFDNQMNAVITLDPDLEQTIMASVQQTEQGSYLALDPSTTRKVFDSMGVEVKKLTSMGLQPIILTSPVVRMYFKRLVEQTAPDLAVLSYNEVDPSAEIQSVGMVSVS
ncbi:MAG: flagellar biosynthesis protein FlhA [Clostridiales bacterium]|jgi:flagellar biosynthesis protein FlhA|nr:flagellar biosynthesis protein FlhA [Clostridiales bacterium]